MKRRTLLKSVAALAAAPVLAPIDILGQTAAPISAKDAATLSALAEVVLPSAIGFDGREEAVTRFLAWVKNYKEGADRGHSYGASTLAAPMPALRLTGYPAQLAALDAAAQANGARSFPALSVAQRRAVVEASLAGVQTNNGGGLPARPTGANLIADFMGLYFASAEATDLAYNASIERDTCRGLDGSEKEPPRRGK